MRSKRLFHSSSRCISLASKVLHSCATGTRSSACSVAIRLHRSPGLYSNVILSSSSCETEAAISSRCSSHDKLWRIKGFYFYTRSLLPITITERLNTVSGENCTDNGCLFRSWRLWSLRTPILMTRWTPVALYYSNGPWNNIKPWQNTIS